jgi:hypothetical protein
MAITIVRDGQVVHTDKKESVEDRLAQQEQIIKDLQNQIKDLKTKTRGKKVN